ncbi:MAG: hypothetical protein K6A71_06250 [Lachnospiraceae bacterium]|nr:hypothetical protein [Lachnospiraceae bacterium]
MAGKFGKFLAFTAVTAAACGAVYYVLGNRKEAEYGTGESGASDIFEKKSREYVSLSGDDIKDKAEDLKEKAEETKDVIMNKLNEAATEMKEKAREVAEGVGLVKDEDKDTEDFEFDDFTTEEEEG